MAPRLSPGYLAHWRRKRGRTHARNTLRAGWRLRRDFRGVRRPLGADERGSAARAFLEKPGKGWRAARKQLIVNFLCVSVDGPIYYVGREMKLSHEGMGIDESDWRIFVGCLHATLDKFKVPASERAQVLGFIDSTMPDI